MAERLCVCGHDRPGGLATGMAASDCNPTVRFRGSLTAADPYPPVEKMEADLRRGPLKMSQAPFSFYLIRCPQTLLAGYRQDSLWIRSGDRQQRPSGTARLFATLFPALKRAD